MSESTNSKGYRSSRASILNSVVQIQNVRNPDLCPLLLSIRDLYHPSPVASGFFCIWILFSPGSFCIMSFPSESFPIRTVFYSVSVTWVLLHSDFRHSVGLKGLSHEMYLAFDDLVLGLSRGRGHFLKLFRCSNDFILQNTCHQKRNPSRGTVPLSFYIQGSGAEYSVSTGYTGRQHAIFMR